MTDGASVFACLERAQLVEQPFPHLVVADAFPPQLAAQLLAKMPPLEVFTRGSRPRSNVRFALPSHVALGDARVSLEWKAALQRVLDAMPAFLAGSIRRFERHIHEEHPDFVARFSALEQLRAVPRHEGSTARNEVGMDAQMVVNSPAAIGGTSVRGPHVDDARKLLSGLLYLRSTDDDSSGGELELFRPRARLVFDPANQIAPRRVSSVVTYPYRHNLLVLPLGSARAIHGVSARGRTARPRYHLHLVGELPTPLFDLPRGSLVERALARVAHRYRGLAALAR